MRTDWYKGCKTEAEKEERRKLVKSSTQILRVINNILDGMVADLELERSKKSFYDLPAWAYLQADNNGAMRTVKQIKTLLDQEEIK